MTVMPCSLLRTEHTQHSRLRTIHRTSVIITVCHYKLLPTYVASIYGVDTIQLVIYGGGAHLRGTHVLVITVSPFCLRLSDRAAFR